MALSPPRRRAAASNKAFVEAKGIIADVKDTWKQTVRTALTEDEIGAAGRDTAELAAGLQSDLATAVCRGDVEQVQELFLRGASLSSQDAWGHTLMHWACGKGRLGVAKWLFEKSAAADAQDSGGVAPMHWACQNGHIEVIHWLFENGAPLDVVDKMGLSPMMWACRHGQFEAVKWLFENGAGLNVRDKIGFNAAHHACQNGDFEMIKWFIDNGADMNLRGGPMGGITPVQMADDTQQAAVAAYLNAARAARATGKAGPGTAAGKTTAPRTNASCFFIDTKTRSDKNTSTPSNRLRLTLKLLLVMLSSPLHWLAMGSPSLLSSYPPVADGASSLAAGTSSLTARQHASLLCSALFVARVVTQALVLWDRAIGWREVWAECGLIIPGSVIALGLPLANNDNDNSNNGEGAGAGPYSFSSFSSTAVPFFFLLLAVAGSTINLGSELQRHMWKKDPCNRGRLFTGGLWRYARRVNYSGEILFFLAWAAIGGAAYCYAVPAAMGFGMAFFSTPEIEFYLKRRYARDWPKYAADVPWRLVPFVW